MRWDVLNGGVGWLGHYEGPVVARRALGFSLVDVVGEELERRGLAVVLPSLRVGQGRESPSDACLGALREAAVDAPAGRLSLPKIQTALHVRDDRPTAAQLSRPRRGRAARLERRRDPSVISGLVADDGRDEIHGPTLRALDNDKAV